jgi:hypothetical protein
MGLAVEDAMEVPLHPIAAFTTSMCLVSEAGGTWGI